MTAQVKILRRSDVERCPKHSMLPAHYHEDGTCLCAERATLVAQLATVRAEKRAVNERVRRIRSQVEVS
jgi:hypothetical protein